MSTQPASHFTPEQYLAFERGSDTKHEYFRGEIFAMSGASRAHNLINVNLTRLLANALADGPCEVYAQDMRVKVDRTGLYTYPDGVVTCEEPRFEDEAVDTLLNPQAIFEVLSESTELYDRVKKFGHYRQVDSLREYFLVAQDRPAVERYTRTTDGEWSFTDAVGLEATIRVESAGAALSLAELYAKVTFPESGED